MSEDIIAVRELYLEGKPLKKFKVEIARPRLSEDGLYRCEVHLEGAPEGLNRVEFGGTDSYQALILAVQTIPQMVETYNDGYMDSKLRWIDGTEDLGFELDLLKEA